MWEASLQKVKFTWKSTLPAQGLSCTGLVVVVLVALVGVVTVCVGSTERLSSWTRLSSSGFTAHQEHNNGDHLTYRLTSHAHFYFLRTRCSLSINWMISLTETSFSSGFGEFWWACLKGSLTRAISLMMKSVVGTFTAWSWHNKISFIIQQLPHALVRTFQLYLKKAGWTAFYQMWKWLSMDQEQH